MKAPALLTVAAFAAFAAARAQSAQRPWNHDVIYFALTDRFLDGDPANDTPAGCDPALYDATQSDLKKYHGGDLRGLELAIQSGYFNDLGVTALWITPPVRNVWFIPFDLGGPNTGYHGYWAQDFLDIDPHLTSAASLDGKTKYPDSREGRLAHYRDFIALAHAHGLKVIQDIVCNHTGPDFYYDANGNSAFDRNDAAEWTQPFRADGFHSESRWAEIPEWDIHRTGPDGPLTLFGKKIATTGVLADLGTYGRKGYDSGDLGRADRDVICDFGALRDVWTEPHSAHFERLVNEFVEIYRFYIADLGVDGLRIDTVKHVHHAFWDAFTARLRQRLGEKAKRLFLFGEVYQSDAATLGSYTWREDGGAEPCLDAVLNFEFCFAARGYLRVKDRPFGDSRAIEQALRDLRGGPPAHLFYNPTPGLDGLNARQKTVNFIENHDGLNRFLVGGVAPARNTLANALLLTMPGIPCLYYGTETALADPDGAIGRDGESGRRTFIARDHAEQLAAAKQSAPFREIAELLRLRRELPALLDGEIAPLWSDSADSVDDDGIFAFARYLEKNGVIDTAKTLVIVCNANPANPATTGIPGHPMRLAALDGRPLLAPGDQLRRIFPASAAATAATHEGIAEATLTVAPQSLEIFRVAPAKPR